METIAQQETKAILRLKADLDAAIKDRDLWKEEAERWRDISRSNREKMQSILDDKSEAAQ